MKHIHTIIRKESLDTLRDRRTLIVMVLVPVLLFPVLFIALTRLQTSVMEREQVRLVRVGWVNQDDDPELELFFSQQERMELVNVQD
ncbi:MAG: hypothetical protein ACLFS0_06450, partial [Bacteroidales bacterium]